MFGFASLFNNPTRLIHSSDFSELIDGDLPEPSATTGAIYPLTRHADAKTGAENASTSDASANQAQVQDRAA